MIEADGASRCALTCRSLRRSTLCGCFWRPIGAEAVKYQTTSQVCSAILAVRFGPMRSQATRHNGMIGSRRSRPSKETAATERLLRLCRQLQGVQHTAHVALESGIDHLVLLHPALALEGARRHNRGPVVIVTRKVGHRHVGVGKRLLDHPLDLVALHAHVKSLMLSLSKHQFVGGISSPAM